MRVLYASDDLLAVDKPEGLAAIPGREGQASLLAQLSAARAERLYVVHRLDKDASGVLLLARNAAAHRYLNGLFAGRAVRKTYLALAHGALAADSLTIDAPLREFGSGRVGVDMARGKASQTEVEVIERLPAVSLLHIHPVTGRRHQIRAHLYHVGHPLVGDTRYGDRATQAAYPRLMLHAQRIELRLPDGAALSVEAPPPPSFTEVVEALR